MQPKSKWPTMGTKYCMVLPPNTRCKTHDIYYMYIYIYIYIYVYILLFSAIDCVDALEFGLDAPTLGVSMLNANSSHRCINVCCYSLWMPPGRIQMHHCSNIHTCRQHTKDDRMFKHVPFYQHTIVWFTMHNTNSLTYRYNTHFKIHAAIDQVRTTHRTC